MTDRVPAWLDFLFDPAEHAFVPNPKDAGLCNACGEVKYSHPVDLEERERRVADFREHERRRIRRSMGLEP